MSTPIETSRSNHIVCPKCNGDYWADPLRKCSNCLNGRVLAPQPAPDAEGEWKTFGRIVHQPGKDERGHPADRFQFEVENTNGLLQPGEAERIAAKIVADHTQATAVPKLVEALREVRKAYNAGPSAERIRIAMDAAIDYVDAALAQIQEKR